MERANLFLRTLILTLILFFVVSISMSRLEPNSDIGVYSLRVTYNFMGVLIFIISFIISGWLTGLIEKK